MLQMVHAASASVSGAKREWWRCIRVRTISQTSMHSAPYKSATNGMKPHLGERQSSLSWPLGPLRSLLSWLLLLLPVLELTGELA